MTKLLSIVIITLLALYFILSVSIAEMTYQASPDKALKFRPNFAKALIKLNDNDLANSAPGFTGEGIKKRTQSLLKSEPLSASVFWQLGLIESINGKVNNGEYDRAKALLKMAQQRNPRTRASAIGQYDLGVLTSDFGLSVHQLDLLMRLDKSQVEKYMSIMLALAQNSATHDEIATIMVRNPAWAEKFMHALVVREGGRPVLSLKIIEAAAQSPQQLLSAESALQTLIDQLVSLKQYTQAKQIWRRLNLQENHHTGFVFDSNFIGLKAPRPFNWYLHHSEHGFAEFEPEKSLLVSSLGRKRVMLAQQLVILPQNREYNLRVDVDGQFRSRHGGFVIWLICTETGKNLAEINIDDMKNGQRELTKTFVLKDKECKAQHLQIFGKKAEYPSQVNLLIRKIEIDEVDGVGDEP